MLYAMAPLTELDIILDAVGIANEILQPNRPAEEQEHVNSDQPDLNQELGQNFAPKTVQHGGTTTTSLGWLEEPLSKLLAQLPRPQQGKPPKGQVTVPLILVPHQARSTSHAHWATGTTLGRR